MSAYPGWLTLRELDSHAGCAKGTAFRAFKRIEAELHEGEDYVLLDHQQAAQTIAELKEQGRAYQSTVNLLLLHPEAAGRIAGLLGNTARDHR